MSRQAFPNITFLQSIWGELDGYGIEPGSSEAVLFALGRSFHEWSVFPYAFYGICSISIAYLCFNKKQPVSLSTLLVPLFGDKVKKRRISSLIDAVNILALALALVGTLHIYRSYQCLRKVCVQYSADAHIDVNCYGCDHNFISFVFSERC